MSHDPAKKQIKIFILIRQMLKTITNGVGLLFKFVKPPLRRDYSIFVLN